MIDTGMIKWFAEMYMDTDPVWTAAAKKALENMDRVSLKRLLNTHYGLLPTQVDYMTTLLIWDELQRRNKEKKKMEDKKYYSGSVAVTTWKERKTFKGDYTTSNHRTDTFTYKGGRCSAMHFASDDLPEEFPIDVRKGYTKEEITEAIITAWDKGEYAEDQTDISWIFNPDPEGFTGTVDLATVFLKDQKGDGQHLEPRVTARCRVRIVDGEFFEKLGGSSKLADILKNHKGAFETKNHIETYIENKWCVRDFGDDDSYFTLDIKED